MIDSNYFPQNGENVCWILPNLGKIALPARNVGKFHWNFQWMAEHGCQNSRLEFKHTARSYEDLRDDPEFSDVTLVCEER